MDRDERAAIGWREWVGLPDLGVPWIKAKVDTGARTSSLHVIRPQIVERDGGEVVRFRVTPLQKRRRPEVAAEVPVLEWRIVRSSGGHETNRPVILTELALLGLRFPIELTLVPRDAMGFRMLLGREALRTRFVVDPARGFVDRAAKREARRFVKSVTPRRRKS